MRDMFKNDAAFAPMFDEAVCVVSKRDGKTVRTSFHVSVFSEGTSEPIGEGVIDTELEAVTFLVRQADWPSVKAMRRGDVIERPDGRKYQVKSVRRDEVTGWTVTAREV